MAQSNGKFQVCSRSNRTWHEQGSINLREIAPDLEDTLAKEGPAGAIIFYAYF